MKPDDPAGGPWHLDKRVPIATIGALILQFIGFIVAGAIYAANIDARLRTVELYQADNKTTQSDLAVLKSQVSDIKETLRRMEGQLADNERERPR